MIIFGAGLLFGLWIGQERVNELEQTTLDLKHNIEVAELQFALSEILDPEIACNYLISTANNLGEESDRLALEIERFENSQKLDDDAFFELKKEYTTTVIRNWVTLEKIKNTCTSDYSTVLYFYSNEECNNCEDQGIVLTHLKGKLKQEILIFPLDVDLGQTTVNALKESYKIDKYPSIILENEVYSGFLSLEEISSVLCVYNEELGIC